jgi:hypothetical protein
MDKDLHCDVFKTLAKNCISAWPGIIWNGTTTHDMRSMLDAPKKFLLFHDCGFEWERSFAHRSLEQFRVFSRELKSCIEGADAFAIVGISKPWEHWTCTHRLTAHEMIMTDSYNVKQILLAKCGRAGDGTDCEFDYHENFVLRKTELQ